MPKVGAHVSAAVSLETSFAKAKNIGAECTQIFISPPQQWAKTKHDEAEIARYQQAAKQSGIGLNFIHGTYLVNLGTQDEEHLHKSIDWLIYAMNLAAQLGSRGVVFHTGSHKGVGFEAVLSQITDSLKKILEGANRRLPDVNHEPFLILETAAGAGDSIGGNFSELGQILAAVDDPRLKICIDTAHVFAAGYDIRTHRRLEETLVEFDRKVGLTNLVAVHANDSKVALGSGKDRHENIGEGFIGREGFENIINHPQLAGLPFILEVPGCVGTGPDTENVRLLKSLRSELKNNP